MTRARTYVVAISETLSLAVLREAAGGPGDTERDRGTPITRTQGRTAYSFSSWSLDEAAGDGEGVAETLARLAERVQRSENSFTNLRSLGCTIKLRVTQEILEAEENDSVSFELEPGFLQILGRLMASIEVDQYPGSS